MYRSIGSDNIPEQFLDYIVDIFPSGWTVCELKDDPTKTKITFLSQMRWNPDHYLLDGIDEPAQFRDYPGMCLTFVW